MMFEERYLSGKCLIAMPDMQDENFAGTVIYLCSHSQSGAMGFVINQKIQDFSFADLAARLPVRSCNINLYRGGPLEKVRGFVLHSTDYIKGDTVVIDNEMAVSSSLDILNDIACGSGPQDNLIALGYASWQPGQLEQEIVNNCWMVANPGRELIFRTKDEEKWQKAMDELGIDLIHLSPRSGRA